MEQTVKKQRLYGLIFKLCLCSIIVAVVLKISGVDIFSLPSSSYSYPVVEFILKLIILLAEYVLIAGCVVAFKFRKLFIKMLPFLPLTAILYYSTPETHFAMSVVILFATCLALRPKFSTVLSFVFNIILISVMQLVIIWLRLDVKLLIPVTEETFRFAVMNIDQLIILTALYFINRKRGERYGLVIFRKKD